MKGARLSFNVSIAHRLAGEMLAASYLADLAKINPVTEDALTFGTLEGRAQTFRYELAQRVYQSASLHGVRNIKVRHEIIVNDARWLIKQALKDDPTLARKLIIARQTAQAVADYQARAEQATWAPLPIES